MTLGNYFFDKKMKQKTGGNLPDQFQQRSILFAVGSALY